MTENIVKARVKELIPTAKYANVEIDLEIQGEKEFIVKNAEGLKSLLSEAYDIADSVLQEKREPIIEELEAGM